MTSNAFLTSPLFYLIAQDGETYYSHLNEIGYPKEVFYAKSRTNADNWQSREAAVRIRNHIKDVYGVSLNIVEVA